LEGGRTASHTSHDRLQEAHGEIGDRALYLLAVKDQDPLVPPVFEVDEPDHRTIAIFSNRNLALLYLQVAGWMEIYEPFAVTPHMLSEWLREAHTKCVRELMIDPERDRQSEACRIPIETALQQSGEELFRTFNEKRRSAFDERAADHGKAPHKAV